MSIIIEIILIILFILSKTLSIFPFFRNWFNKIPKTAEITPSNSIIISPAGGTIKSIKEFQSHYIIHIFIGLMDSHVQYYPISGKIVYKNHNKGNPFKFLNLAIQYPAYEIKSKYNEHTTLVIRNKMMEIIVIQVAGILATRIITKGNVGDEVIQGQQLGRIILGSSVILVIPKIRLIISENQKIFPIKTIIGTNFLRE